MKRLHSFAWLPVYCLLILVASLASCKRDKCKRVTCINGECVDGTCICDAGYFKEDCSSILNAGYDGIWALTEECTAGSDLYDLNIAAITSNLGQLRIQGLWGKPDAVTADLGADGTSIAIARQRIANVELTATGTINAAQDKIVLAYEVYYLGFSQSFDRCTATISKN